jgi:aspartyl-tRNA synthetase
MAGLKRTHMCGRLSPEQVDQEVVLTGWVNRTRDHGGLIFVDLRDRTGMVQVVFSPEVNAEVFAVAETIRGEYVIAVTGCVQLRPAESVNPHLATGQVEVYVSSLRILNKAKTPPFYITENLDADESVRLRYRYLDLRRPDMQQIMFIRHQTTKVMRDFLDAHGFWEIETPMLTSSTPEGARDFLVPSRLNPGSFYALPQSPQLFKQILMVAGMDRYFQIVRCFRDEDLRADRQPEFTQLDLEMSFITRDEIMELMEALIADLFQKVLGVTLQLPVSRLSYQEAMARYGSDKPDLRFGLELVDVSDLMAGSTFKVFADTVQRGGQVKGLTVPEANFSRKELDELTALAAKFGAKGLAWMVVNPEGIRSPLTKFFSAEELARIQARLQAKPGDVMLFVADQPLTAAEIMGRLRLALGKKMGLIKGDAFSLTWVTDFPLLEYNQEEKRYQAMHHPFTAPVEADLPLLDTNPGQVRAQAYDLVLNGTEIGGGSIRIHQRPVQEKMFHLLNLSQSEAGEKFGHLLEAFDYGAPPHGGIAFGLDRLVMIMTGRATIRDVIAFPKTQSATCLMTGAPTPVASAQLRELHLKQNMPQVLESKNLAK